MNQFNQLSGILSSKFVAKSLFFLTTIFFIIQLFNLIKPFPKENNSTPLLSLKHPIILNQNSVVFNQAIFGNYQPIHSDEDIKQSSLDLDVVGIMYSSDKVNSQVLIRAAGGEEKLYKVGDSLPGGVIIKKINKQTILLLYQGELESLSLPKNELIFGKPAKILIKE